MNIDDLIALDPMLFIGKLIGKNIARKLFDRISNVGAKRRAITRALERSISTSQEQHSLFWDVLVRDRSLSTLRQIWKKIEEQVFQLLSTTGEPDIKCLAAEIREFEGEMPENMEKILTDLFQLLSYEISKEPDLFLLGSFRRNKVVDTKLAQICDALGIDVNIGSIESRARESAKSHLGGFMQNENWPQVPVFLRLSIGLEEKSRLDSEGFIELLDGGKPCLIEAIPGGGKTTTLIQIADQILNDTDNVIPLFIPLSSWLLDGRDCFEYMVTRGSFVSQTANHLRLLGIHGRLLLCFDGWNELSGRDLKRAEIMLRDIVREYPSIGVILTSRRAVQSPKLPNLIKVNIEELTREQRREVIAAQLSGDTDRKIDHIHNHPELDAITLIPLYLSVYMAISINDLLPKTKEQLLGAFVESNEVAAEHSGPLREVLSDYHNKYLKALSFEMARNETPVLSRDQARKVVSKCAAELEVVGLIKSPEPKDILKVLIGHHLLVCSGDAGHEVYSFVHQLFQEWYASHKVEELISKNYNVYDEEALNYLKVEILDKRSWEETILFAIERLSGKAYEGRRAAAYAIEQTLKIDPMFSARMICRAGEGSWRDVDGKIQSFARNWYTNSKSSRAINFMTATGRPEFSDIVLPLIFHENPQIRDQVFNHKSQIKISVFGSTFLLQFQEQTEDIRKDLVYDIVHQGSLVEVTSFLEEIARNDPSMEVRYTILEGLAFRHAWGLLDEILLDAPLVVWELLAHRNWFASELNREHIIRLINVTKAMLGTELTCLGKIRLIVKLHDLGDEEAVPLLFSELENCDFESQFEIPEILVRKSAAINKEATSTAIINRLLKGRTVPRFWGEFVIPPENKHDYDSCNDSEAGFSAASVMWFKSKIDSTSLLSRMAKGLFGEMFGQSEKEVQSKGILTKLFEVEGNISREDELSASLLLPNEVSILVERLLQYSDELEATETQYIEELSKKTRKTEQLLRCVSGTSLIKAVFHYSEVRKPEHIALLVSILNRHDRGDEYEDTRLIVPDVLYVKLRPIVLNWIEVIREDEQFPRGRMVQIAVLIGRLGRGGDLNIISELLEFELLRYQGARDILKKGGPPSAEAHMSYFNQYLKAFMSMPEAGKAELMIHYLNEPEFAPYAARVLWKMAQEEMGVKEHAVVTFGNPEFSEVRTSRVFRIEAGEKLLGHPFAFAVLNRVQSLLADTSDDRNAARALELSMIASAMNFGNSHEVILEAITKKLDSEHTYNAIKSLTLAGVQVPGDIIYAGYQYSKTYWDSEPWRRRENWCLIERWLDLLLLSDRFDQGFSEILAFNQDYLSVHRFIHIFKILASCPPSEVVVVSVQKLVESRPELLKLSQWCDVLLVQGTEQAGMTLLKILSTPTLCEIVVSNHQSRSSMAKGLAELINHPNVHEKLSKYLTTDVSTFARAVICRMIEWVDKDEIFFSVLDLLLLDSSSSMLNELSYVLEKRVTNHVLIEGSNNVYEIEPSAATDVRKYLFSKINHDSARKDSAKKALEWIDDQRDQYGNPEGEPRHPDIATGIPWPIVECLAS